ncbi:hypothetical protein BRAS3843_3160039 [Bradyrhizobium sp. STM 3843]|nr:hypothetical protein BRAS3843_3160039 [Bradyrhizobium sp. STM 3843]
MTLDARPCSGPGRWKVSAGAISKAAAGGELSAVDPGYRAITITTLTRLVGPAAAGLAIPPRTA